MLLNERNLITKKSFFSVKVRHTMSIHTPYTHRGFFGKSRNEKSLNTFHIKAFECGADETRTRDLLRDRQAF
jgi:hypothetical protein